jgi:tetratricopeptide (TPR) repeat protein
LVRVSGPKFRSAKIYPNRKLSFNLDRDLPFGKKGISFRKSGVLFRKKGISFGNDGVSNIDLDSKDKPAKLNRQGIQYYNKGKYDVALKYFDKALSIAPQFKEARNNRGYCIKMINAQRERRHRYENAQMHKAHQAYIERIPKTSFEPVVVHPIDHKEYNWHDFEQPYEFRPPPQNRIKKETYYEGSSKWSGPNRRSFQ